MILGVTGSRVFQANPPFNKRATVNLFTEALNVLKPDMVVHGGAQGPDMWANAWAKGRGVASRVILPTNHTKQGYLARDRQIIMSGIDKLLVCWDEKSGGTGYTYDFAAGEGVECVTVPILTHRLDGTESETVRRYRREWLAQLL